MGLQTTYMGIQLKNPILAGASTLTSNLDTLRALEEAGIAAVVISSLFEEQIQLERLRMEEDRTMYDNLHPEMISIFPKLEHAGPQEHLMWVRKAKESLSIPVIASLNAVNRETWVEYASLLEQTGVDGLELNFYATPTDPSRSGAEIEAHQIATLSEIRARVSIPISVKLSALYTNPLHFAVRLDEAGANGLVLFNRFFQPDVDPEQERSTFRLSLSREGDYGLSLRFTGLLYGHVKSDICANTGIFTGEDAIRLILVGATCVQVVSTLFQNQVGQIGRMLQAMEQWMERKGYASLDECRGKLSHRNTRDPWMYTRAQYVRALMKPDPLERPWKVI